MKKYKASVFEAAATIVCSVLGFCPYVCLALESIEGTQGPHATLFRKTHRPPGTSPRAPFFGSCFIIENQELREALCLEAALCLREQGFSED